MIEAALAQPSYFDFWLEYLHLQPDLVQWAETFDVARVNWQLDLCWRLLREARRWAETPSQRGTVRHYEGMFHAQGGDWARAEQCYRTALEEIPPTDVETRLALLGELGMLERIRGNGRAALEIHHQQLSLADSYGVAEWQAEALDQLGMDYELLNDWSLAQRALQRALSLYQELEDIEETAGCSNRLGLVAFRQGRLEEAATHLKRARSLFDQLERPYELAQVEGNLGNLAYARGEWMRAEQHYHAALTLFDALGVVFDQIGILNNLGSLALAREDWEQAYGFYKESLALARDLGDRREERDVLINLGVASLRQNLWDEAARYYSHALTLTRELRDRGASWDLRRRQLRLWLLRGLDWLLRKVAGG